MMATDTRQRSKPAPLTAQVTQAERRLLYRRRMVGFRASRLQSDLRKQLTAPGTLLVAVGVGFAIGHLQKRHNPAADRDDGSSHNKLLGLAFKVLSWAPVLFRPPPAAAMESSSPSAWSSQLPEAAGPLPASSGRAM